MNATAIYLAALAAGHTPSDAELSQLCTALHNTMTDKPLMLWLDRSFEDMADTIEKAITCGREQEEIDEFFSDSRRRLGYEVRAERFVRHHA